MQRNNPLKKGFTLVIIVLFIGVSIIPLTGSNAVEKSSLSIEETAPSFEGVTPYLIDFDSEHDRFPLMHRVGKEDTTAPDIRDITLTTSEPLDTIYPFGWGNFSCTVTDNTGVDEVKLVLTGDTTTLYPMVKDGDNYYCNITLSTADEYTYYIWAYDTNGNGATSSPEQFGLPPNHDVDGDGQTYFNDLMSVIWTYGDTGLDYPSPSSFGWVREDIDNDRQVYFNDLMNVIWHYAEWWK